MSTKQEEGEWSPLAMRQVEEIRLSERDSIAFAEMMLNPPKATDALRAAIADYLNFFNIQSIDDLRVERQADEQAE